MAFAAVALFLVMGAAPATGTQAAELDGAAERPTKDTPLPKEDRSRGLVYRGLSVDSKACPGSFEVTKTGRCTHGPDAPPAGYRMGVPVAALKTSTPSSTVAATCVGDGTSGNRVQVLYVHAAGNDRFAQYQASFVEWAFGMDTIYDESAKETGGRRHIRFVHDSSCAPIVQNVTVSSAAMNDFGTMISTLDSQGFNRRDRKYVVFADANLYCGIGEFAGDTRPTADNASNFGPSFGRTDTSCWGASTASHELAHNLGAVNNNAPNTSGGGHCTDEYDVMCYSDSPNYPTMRYVCTDRAQDARLDCNHDDYYHTNPPAGSYLARNWNTANSAFLDGGGDTTPPPGGCASSPEKYTGTLATGSSAIQPNGTYFYSSGSGDHVSCLDGPDGTDFDLELRKWNGSAWVTVKSATTASPDENMTHSGTAGYYYYRVVAHSGSGTFTLGIERP